MFREGTGDDDVSGGDPLEEDDLLDAHGRIRCPRCAWRPRKDDAWQCSCFHVWNTFDTRGMCPACGIQWKDTQCLSCKQWSPHEAWYAKAE